MNVKRLGIVLMCGLLLFGCASKANSNEDSIIEDDNDDVEVVEVQEVAESDEFVVAEVVEEIKEELLNQGDSAKVEEVKKEEKSVESTNTGQKKEESPKPTEQPKQESKPVEETPAPTPEPTPTPTSSEPPKQEQPKEEPKKEEVKEEVKYGGYHQSDKATSVFNKINEVRVNNGLSELPWSDGDTWLANTRVEELVSEVANNTVHSGLKKYDRYVGEIAACGYSPSGAVEAWMASSGHVNQILADYNTSMAVGVYYDEYTASSYYIVIFR